MSNWTGRTSVVEALEAAGWNEVPGYRRTLLRHPSGAVFGIHSPLDGCGLDTPNGASVEFPGDTPDAVVIAACLAAADHPGASLAVELHDEEHAHARTRLALRSAKRRALRRLPHEREGLIFHLERQNQRLTSLLGVMRAAADASVTAGEETAVEAYGLRARVGHLQDRIRVLEATLGRDTPPCGRELSTGEACPDHPHPPADAATGRHATSSTAATSGSTS
ncbi:hypothetical protein [Streptomyces fuscigenes]|uniref:hypothetical protein n=1 Tax=Streptomyces fuscigenes TaxID=1528880 RepID=UPI001F1B4140|nr:hypothetical protein [Streptomyces fuscigenes]MCF3960320.1 hypothetical protein [Streptomyces fuscigenes]